MAINGTNSVNYILLTNQKNIQILLSEIIMHAQQVINADKLHGDINLITESRSIQHTSIQVRRNERAASNGGQVCWTPMVDR